MTKKEFADAIGLKPRQIDNLVIDGLPRSKRGRSYGYEIEAVVWYFRRREEREKATRPDLKESQERFEAARARKMEIELELLQEETVKARTSREEVARVLDRLRAAHLNVPAVVAPRLLGCKTLRQMTAQLTEGMREGLQLLQATADDNTGHNGRRPAKKKAAKRAVRRGSRKASSAS